MKKSFFLTGMLFALVAIAAGFSSCSKVDEWTADPNDVKSINAIYSVELSQTWYDYYDVMVTYYDEKAQPQTLQIYSRWDYSISLPPKKAPRNFVLTVTATPKENNPGFENRLPIIFSQNISAEFYAVRYDGSIYKELSHDITPVHYTSTETRSLTSEQQFKEFFNRGPKTLFKFTKSWDGTY